MDWTKAKTILIIALLLTDCILGGLYFYQYVKMDTAPQSEIQDTLEFLENHNVYVDTEIPGKSRRMPVLFVKYEENDEKEIKKVLSHQNDIEGFEMSEQNIKDLCDDILRQCGFTEESLVYSSCRIDGTSAKVIYKNVYDNIPVEASGIRCTVEDGTVTAVDRLWLTPTGYGKTKQKVMQITDALIQFTVDWVKKKNEDTTGAVPDEIHIEKIDLVYWLDSSVGPSDGVEDTALPAWRLTYNGGEETFIDAFDQQ